VLGVTFVWPMVTAAAGAAAAPVLIHLILRTRPRRVVFPALQFVRRTRQASIKMLRLKHLLLLAARMAAIVLIALLIARAQVPTWRSVPRSASRTAAVIVMDDSGSMQYVEGERSRLARARAAAQELIRQVPSGSRLAVMTTSGRGPAAAFASDRKLVLRELGEVRGGCGGRAVWSALAKATDALRGQDLPRKQVFLLTDMTQRAWRGGGPPAGDANVQTVVIDCGSAADLNVVLEPPPPVVRSVPAGHEQRIEVGLHSEGVGGDMPLGGAFDGARLDPCTVRLSAGGSAWQALTVRPRRPGVAHGRVELLRDDPLAADNVRYFTLTVSEPVRVLLVRERAKLGRRDPTYHLVLPPYEEVGWVRQRTVFDDRFDAEALDGRDAVVLCGVTSLTDTQWRALGAFVRGGGDAIVLAGAAVSTRSYGSAAAQQVLPGALRPPVALRPAQACKAADERHPLLRPFAEGRNGSPSDITCRRRYPLASRAADAETVLAYADGEPAVLSRRVGDGQVVLWTFSLDPAFCRFALGSTFLPVFLVHAAERFVAAESGGWRRWGDSVSIPVPKGFESAAVRVTAGDDRAAPPVDRTPRVVTLVADRLGAWTVRFEQDGEEAVRGFSVNMDPAESDLARADANAVAAMFPAGSVSIVAAGQPLDSDRRRIARPLDLTVPLLLGLLALLIAESFFANRFYRRPAAEPQAP
jgi:hypothetical protein